MIINDQILEDDDSNQFVGVFKKVTLLEYGRSEIEGLINSYDADEPVPQPSPIVDNSFPVFGEKRISSNSKLLVMILQIQLEIKQAG